MFGSQEPSCATNAEEHEVSCCADSNPGSLGWINNPNFKATCPDVWGMRRPDGTNSHGQ